MNIGTRLYRGFGVTIGLLLFIAIVNIASKVEARSSSEQMSKLFHLQQKTASISAQMGKNRQLLANYILSGSSQDGKDLSDGNAKVQTDIENAIAMSVDVEDKNNDVKGALNDLKNAESSWIGTFASPLADSVRQVNEGNKMIADVQKDYFTKRGDKLDERSKEPLDRLEKNIASLVEKKEASTSGTRTFVLWLTIF